MSAKLLLGIGVISLLMSCSDSTKTKTMLSELERPIYDSLYSIKVETARNQIDSLCDLHRDSLYARAVDSIFDVRLLEIKLLLNEEQNK